MNFYGLYQLVLLYRVFQLERGNCIVDTDHYVIARFGVVLNHQILDIFQIEEQPPLEKLTLGACQNGTSH